MKTFEQYTDENGCLMRHEYGTRTGGDSLSYLGFYYTLAALDKDANKSQLKMDFALRLFQHRGKKGYMVRHPNKELDASSIYRTSRDQYMPLLTAMALLKLKSNARALISPIFKMIGNVNRFFFMPNIQVHGEPNWREEPANWTKGRKIGDFFGIEQLGVLIRATRYWPLYPALFFLDIFALLSTIWKCIYALIYPSHTDDQTRLCSLLVGLKVYPTPLSVLSWFIYKYLRPAWKFQYYEHLEDYWFMKKERRKQVLANYKLTRSIPGWQYALDTRFGGENEPPFNELAKKVLK